MVRLLLCLMAVRVISASAADLSATNSASSSTTNSPSEPQPYIRVTNPDTNTLALQIAVRRFVPDAGHGPVFWLVGTAHLGDPAYYHALQKHLDAQTIVLFEGVNSDAHPRHVLKPGESPDTNAASAFPPPAGTETNAGYSMQSALASSLGLVFQLDAIDYDRTNFLNSDLSVLQIQRLLLNDPDATAAAPGEKGRSDPTFDALLQIMDGSSFLGTIAKWGVQYIGSDPKMRATTKFMLIEALGGLKGDFSEIRGLPPDMSNLLKILIQARNQNVVDDLKIESARIPASGSIAVFYGTGHMPNLEKRIVKDLHYRPDGDIWFTAFSVDLRETGLAPAEILWTRGFIKAEMEKIQPSDDK